MNDGLREQFAADLSEQLGSLSVRQLADRSGWGKTTVAEIKGGRQLPSDVQLQDLLTAAGATDETVREWLGRRELVVRGADRPRPRLETPAAPAPSVIGSPRRAVWRRPLAVLLAAGTLGVGFGVGYAVGNRTERPTIRAAVLDADPTLPGSALVQLAQGAEHACAVTKSGGVSCWGRGSLGQLGDGTETNSAVPLRVSGLRAGILGIAAGGDSSCAITYDHLVKCWGHNAWGQLGNGQVTRKTTPARVESLTHVQNVVMGSAHTCALTDQGDVYCWGSDQDGQVGNTRFGPVPVARPVVDLPGTTIGITAGGDHTCAWSDSGIVSCWGANAFGQLGIGVRRGTYHPTVVSGLTEGVLSVSAGVEHTCAVTRSGRVLCWGRNDFGQLGTGTTGDELVPTQVKGMIAGFSQVAAGANHTCAVGRGGQVWCWGRNDAGQLGTGSRSNDPQPPTEIPDLKGVMALSAGDRSTCAIGGGRGWCWGSNHYGQVGTGPGPDSLEPVEVHP